MTDVPGSKDEGVSEVSDRRPPTPRWVRIAWIVAGLIVILLIAALIFGGEHGPGRHAAPARDGAAATTSADAP